MLYDVPGARSAPFDFQNTPGVADHPGTPECSIEPSCDTSKSPICKYGISAGDHTIDICDPQTPNCPMTREWVPERNIDAGRWTLVNENENKNKNEKKLIVSKNNNNILVYIVLLAIMAYLVMRRN